MRRVIWNPWQSNGKLRNMKSRSFEVLCHKQIQNTRSMGSCSFHPDGNHSSFHPGRNSIRLSPPLHPAAATLHPDVLHQDVATSAAISPRCLTSGTFHPNILHSAHDVGWERRHFKFPRWMYPDSLIAPYPDGRAAILHKCCGILLKLPNICHRHFRIF